MKKFFTALLVLFTLNVAVAQNIVPSSTKSTIENNRLTPAQMQQFNALKGANGSNRAPQQLILDYDGFDEVACTDAAGTYSRFIWRLHSQTPDLAIFNQVSRWGVVVFDTLVDANTGLGYSLATTPYTLDSVDIYFSHARAVSSTNPDSVRVIVYAAAGAAGIQINANQAITNTVLWDTTIITSTNLTASATTLGILTVYPNTTLGQGQRFVVGVEFRGDTTNQFNLLAGYCDGCGDACAAQPSIIEDNSFYRLTFVPSSGGDFSGVNPLILDCNQNGAYDATDCEDYYIQNFVITPFLTIDPPFLADPKASKSLGCPGESIALAANVTGSTNYSVTWSGNGNFTSPNSDNTNVILPAGVNAVVPYTVTVEDLDNNTTITRTVNITVRGITVSLGNDTTIGCTDSILVAAATSGFLNGSTFAWSNGAITQTTYLKGGSTYTVTVTNNQGCTATDNKVVSLNVNQSVSFTTSTIYNGVVSDTLPLIQNSVCQSVSAYFTNTSTDISNAWAFEWNYGDQTGSVNVNGIKSYANTGAYTVTLTATNNDGCVVTSAPQQVTVIPNNATQIHPRCSIVGIREIALLSNIALYPNPNNGSFIVDLSLVNADDANVMVVDMLGKVVYNTNTFSTSATPVQTIDLNNAANGIYFVRVTANGVTATSKISVAK